MKKSPVFSEPTNWPEPSRTTSLPSFQSARGVLRGRSEASGSSAPSTAGMATWRSLPVTGSICTRRVVVVAALSAGFQLYAMNAKW